MAPLRGEAVKSPNPVSLPFLAFNCQGRARLPLGIRCHVSMFSLFRKTPLTFVPSLGWPFDSEEEMESIPSRAKEEENAEAWPNKQREKREWQAHVKVILQRSHHLP